MNYKPTLNLPRPGKYKTHLQSGFEGGISGLWRKTSELKEIKQKRTFFEKPISPVSEPGWLVVSNQLIKDTYYKFLFLNNQKKLFRPVCLNIYGSNIESEVLRVLNLEKKRLEDQEIRRDCKKLVEKYNISQQELFEKLGVGVNPETIEDLSYIVDILKNLWDSSFLYTNIKARPYCPSCKIELEREEIYQKDSITEDLFVKFQVLKKPDILDDYKRPVFILVREDRYWLLPGITALEIKPGETYYLAEKDGIGYLVSSLTKKRLTESSIDLTELKEFSGEKLINLEARHPFHGHILEVYLDVEKPEPEKRGINCIMPAHDCSDFEKSLKYNLVAENMFDSDGNFLNICSLKGVRFSESLTPIKKLLVDNDALFFTAVKEREWNFCSICNSRILIQSMPHWFFAFDMNELRTFISDKSSEMEWHSASSEFEFINILNEMSDWRLTSHRKWGVPFPTLECESCKKLVLNRSVLEKAGKVFEKGIEGWYEAEVFDLAGENFICPHCGDTKVKKGSILIEHRFLKALLSVSSFAGIVTRDCLSLENSRHNLAWLVQSMVLSLLQTRKMPCKKFFSSGKILPRPETLMPEQALKSCPADTLRLLLVSHRIDKDFVFNRNKLEKEEKTRKKISNILAFISANLENSRNKGHFRLNESSFLDRWILDRAQKVEDEIIKHYSQLEFHKAYKILCNFLFREVSGIYLEGIKDELYSGFLDSAENKASRAVLSRLLQQILVLISPVMPFTAEWFWQKNKILVQKAESVFLNGFKREKNEYLSHSQANHWKILVELRQEYYRYLQEEKINIPAEKSQATFLLNSHLYGIVTRYEDDFKRILNVSQLFIRQYENLHNTGGKILDIYPEAMIKIAPGKKGRCPRCRKYNIEGKSEKLCRRCDRVLKKVTEQ
ncbi:MAG: class I tRNA ligase family protein [Vulcanimicrobiota bacterium]